MTPGCDSRGRNDVRGRGGPSGGRWAGCGSTTSPTMQSKNSKRDVLWIAQWVQNLLKHGFHGQLKVVKFDAQEMATDALERAISNYFGLTGEQTPLMKKFHDEHP